MKKFIVKMAIFISLLVICATVTDSVLTSTFQKGNTNKTQWLKTIKRKHFDIAIIGSSRSWWNININRFNEELNLNCISLSNNHFPYSEMLLRLKRFYNNGNSLEYLLIQTEYWSFFSDRTEFSNTVYNNLPFIDDTLTYNYLKNRSSKWIIYKYIPLWRYSQYNRQWGLEEFILTKLKIRNPIYDNTGSFFSNNKFYGKEQISFSKASLITINEDFLLLYDFCLRHNITIGIFTAPLYKANYSADSQVKMLSCLDSLNLKYNDYIDIFDDSTLFNDNKHLSLKGGEIFTDTLIKFSKELIGMKN